MTDINTHVNRRPVGLADECPALIELAAHRADSDAEVARHLQNCPRCRALLRALPAEHVEQAYPDIGFSPAAVSERSQPSGTVTAGELVTVSSSRAPGSLLVALVLDLEANAARVGPIIASADLSDDATARALLPAATPLGYEASVDVDFVGWVDISQIDERFGAIADELLAHVKHALTQPATHNLVAREVMELREEASRFFLPTLGELYRSAEASANALEDDLQSAGWKPKAVAALRRSAIDRTEVSPDQVATLFRLTNWVADGALAGRVTAIRALRLAFADGLSASTARSKATAAMAFLAQLPGISKHTLTADEYVDAVIRALDESDA